MVKFLNNQYFRVGFALAGFTLLYFMYSDNDHVEQKARDFVLLINLNQYFLVLSQCLLSWYWRNDTSNKAHKALFLAFSMFCLLRIIYRSYVLIIDSYLVSSQPLYFMMLACVLPVLLIDLKYGSN